MTELTRERGPVLRAEGLTKVYPSVRPDGQGELLLFRQLSLEVYPGEMIAIIGESGAGKSTLLHLLAALDRPSGGEVWYRNQRLSTLSARQAAELRNRKLGYVWQSHYLLPEFTAAENVALPLMARGMARAAAIERAVHWLGEVGLAARGQHRSGELSGGEQQRVNLARALVTDPDILLADEPTGNLDERTAEEVFQLMRHLHAWHQLTSVLVTHNLTFARRCDRIWRLNKGHLTEA